MRIRINYILGLLAMASIGLFGSCGSNTSGTETDRPTLKLAIAPYQDLAMATVIHPMGMDSVDGYTLEVLSMGWENILPSIVSAGETADIGFGSFVEYIQQYNNLNKAGDEDPLLFIYPAYIFKGGGFVSFNDKVPDLTAEENLNDVVMVKDFLSHSIGASANSVYEMIIYKLASDNGIDYSSLNINDNVKLADGLLAADNGTIDIANAGLTQRNEATRRGGRIVLDMASVGFADITGFIIKKSVYEQKKEMVGKFIKNWFEAVDYVMSDLDNHSKIPFEYLKKQASTQYTIESYKNSLSHEYFPKSIAEANKSILNADGTFYYKDIANAVIRYNIHKGKMDESSTPDINFIKLQ